HRLAQRDVADRGTAESSEDGGAAQGERQRRQHEVLRILRGTLGNWNEAAGRQQPRAQREAQHQHDAEPEVWDRDSDETDGERSAVGEPATPGTTEQAQRNADQSGADACENRELQGHREAIEDHPTDRLVLTEVHAKVAPHDPGEPPHVLLRQRLVEGKRFAPRPPPPPRGPVAQDDPPPPPPHPPPQPPPPPPHPPP